MPETNSLEPNAMTSVPSERVPLSPYDRIKRIRRCASAIEQGVSIKDLVRKKGFSSTEVEAARQMLAEKAKKKTG
jgi:hypothetical protein